MTNSENIIQFGPNAYSKPSTGLNILRETVMGRNLFDFSFREYSRRWAFKHPTPADFFRTMEDASGEDLDWFWRGWFYNTDPCDITIDTVKVSKLTLEGGNNTARPARTAKVAAPDQNDFEDITKIRNREDKSIVFATDADTSLRDFYWRYDRGLAKVDNTPIEIPAQNVTDTFTNEEKTALAGTKTAYEISFKNKGGLVMPIIVEFTYADGTKEVERIPVQIWRKNEEKVTKVFIKDKEAVSIKLDPMRETADIDESNNSWPVKAVPSTFKLFKAANRVRGASAGGVNPMQKEIK